MQSTRNSVVVSRAVSCLSWLMHDKELIEEIKKGNERAFKELVESYKDLVVNTCYGFLQSHEDAEDIAQDVFIEVYKTIQSFREEAKLSTWLYRLAVNKSLNQIKKTRRKKWLTGLPTIIGGEGEEIQVVDIKTPDPQMVLEQEERIKILNQAIGKLAKNQKIAFTLRKYKGLSYKEIAEVMGTTLSAVESLLNRAKKNLEKKLYHYYTKN